MAEPTIRILLADDDPDALLSLRDRLESFGFQVTAVSNGREAVEEMGREEYAYAMVFMDINMPGTDGIEALREIRRIAPETPVIMITANPQRVATAMEAGAQGYLTKPIEPQQLKAAIEQWTKRT
jgi:CheY-like chemotaxis protein